MPALASWWTVILGPKYALYIGLLCGLVIVLVYPHRHDFNRYWPTLVVICVTIVCTAITTSVHQRAVEHSLLFTASQRNLPVHITGTVTSFPIKKHGQTKFFLRAENLRVDDRRDQSSYLLAVEMRSSSTVQRYDVVTVGGKLEECTYRNQSDMCFVGQEITILSKPTGWEQYVGRIHQALIAYDESTSVAHDALVTGIAIGDDSRLPESYRERMRVLGLSHLTAVSGSHISLIILLAIVIVGWRWPLITGGASLVAVYALTTLVSPEPSVIRAVIMGIIYSIGVGLRYSVTAFPLLALTLIGSCLIVPQLATSLGFMLSVVAVWGIVVASRPLSRIMSEVMPLWLSETIAVPYIAGLATLPLVADLQPQVSLLAVVANALVAPVVVPLTILGMSGGVLMPIVPALGIYFLAGAQICSGWIDMVVTYLPCVAVPPIVSAFIQLSIGGMLLYWAHRRRSVANKVGDVEY